MTSTHKVSSLPNRYSWLAWGVGISIALGQPLASANSPTGKFEESKAGKRNATTLTKKNTTADAYSESGKQKYIKGDYQGALSDYNKAISINPKLADAYHRRGVLKQTKLKDTQGALADYNKAISLNPKYALAYSNRAILKNENLNDSQGALADYNKAISLNPKLAPAYYDRGLLKHTKLNDVQGALADYNKAISLNPKLADAYIGRGLLKYEKLNDPQEALADYNKAISLNPKYALAYYNRGLLKWDDNDRAGANRDFQVAARLYRQQGNADDLKMVNEAIARLENSSNGSSSSTYEYQQNPINGPHPGPGP
jgi:tetratricopeptide (TPR) repeat protein